MDGHGGDLSWDEVHHALIPLMKVDNRASVPEIVREYVGLGVVLGVAAALQGGFSSGSVGILAYVAGAAGLVGLVAVFQHRLSGLAHEASHGTLFRNRLANELVSDVFLMFPLVAMTQKYREAHLGHHQFVNDPERDPDLIRLNAAEPVVFPMAKGAFWRRYVWKALWPPSILKYLFGRAKAANLSGGGSLTLRTVYRAKVARCLRGTYWLAVLTAVHALQAWPVLLIFWVVPLLTVYPFLMQLREVAHHSNAPDDGDLTNSRVFEVNPVLGFSVFPYGQAFHLTHHLFAKIPHRRMRQAHAILMRNREYRDRVVVCRGYFWRKWGTRGPSVLDVVSSREVEGRGPRRMVVSGRARAAV